MCVNAAAFAQVELQGIRCFKADRLLCLCPCLPHSHWCDVEQGEHAVLRLQCRQGCRSLGFSSATMLGCICTYAPHHSSMLVVHMHSHGRAHGDEHVRPDVKAQQQVLLAQASHLRILMVQVVHVVPQPLVLMGKAVEAGQHHRVRSVRAVEQCRHLQWCWARQRLAVATSCCMLSAACACNQCDVPCQRQRQAARRAARLCQWQSQAARGLHELTPVRVLTSSWQHQRRRA